MFFRDIAEGNIISLAVGSVGEARVWLASQ